MKELIQSGLRESLNQGYEIGRFVDFVENVTGFYSRNRDIVEGIAVSGSAIDVTRVNPRYSDIDINIILDPGQIFELAKRLSKEEIVLGLYFDTKAPFPLFHAIADVGKWLYRWDTFIFQPAEHLPDDDALRNYEIQVLHDPHGRFSQLKFSRVNSDNFYLLENKIVHTMDWMLYFWNKLSQGKTINPENIALFNSVVMEFFSITNARMSLDYLQTNESLISFINILSSQPEFSSQMTEKDLILLSKIKSQIRFDQNTPASKLNA